MKKAIIFLVIAAALSMISPAFAVSESADCFRYYKFQKGLEFNDMHPAKAEYRAGEKARIFYNIVSHMESPIVEGRVRVQVFYNDPLQKELMIDEFFDMEDISLYKDEKIMRYFNWKIPKNAKDGTYTVKAYFIVGEKFNLAGVSMLPYGPPGAPGELTTFNVKTGGAVSRIYFDKESTNLNDERYSFATAVPIYDVPVPLNIRTKLVNEGAQGKQVTVTMSIYEWDDTTGSPMEGYSVEKKMVVDAGSFVDVDYELPALRTGAYEVKFTAASAEEKAIQKMRFSIGGEMGGIGYLGIDKFPIRAGERVTIFSCVSNTADYASKFTGHGVVEIKDKNGKILYTDTLDEKQIVSDPMGETWEYMPAEDVNYVTLSMYLYDENKNVADKAIMTYDSSKFKSTIKHLNINTDKTDYKEGDLMEYTITLKDEDSNDLRGNVLVYMTNPKGNIFYTLKDRKIDGVLKESVKLYGDKGEYEITVKEVSDDILAKKAITLSAIKVSDRPEDDGGTGNLSMILIAAVIISIITGYVFVQKRKDANGVRV